jgi:hypothetical protein
MLRLLAHSVNIFGWHDAFFPPFTLFHVRVREGAERNKEQTMILTGKQGASKKRTKKKKLGSPAG